MNYSDYIKEFEVASKIPDTANAYNEERVRMQKAEILAEAFCMPKKVALQWVAAAHNASFNCMLLDVRKNILEAERIARTAMSAEAPVWISEENDSRNGYTKSMPVVKHLQGYRTPEIFLRAQAFLYHWSAMAVMFLCFSWTMLCRQKCSMLFSCTAGKLTVWNK